MAFDGTFVLLPTPPSVASPSPVQGGRLYHNCGMVREKVLLCHFFSKVCSCLVSPKSQHHSNKGAIAPLADRRPSLETNPQRLLTISSPPPTHITTAHTAIVHPLACDLVPLTPSVREPDRYSQRTGRHLSESESLQQKHSEEYQFLLPALSHIITHVIGAHEDIAAQVGTNSSSFGAQQRTHELSAFYTAEPAQQTVHGLLRSIIKYAYVSPASLLVACLYVDRLLCQHEGLLLTMHNVFKLFFAAIRVASKIMDTRNLNNKDFATIGNMSNEELNTLELLFLSTLDYDLYVSAQEFAHYTHDLVSAAAGHSLECCQEPSSPNTAASGSNDPCARKCPYPPPSDTASPLRDCSSCKESDACNAGWNRFTNRQSTSLNGDSRPPLLRSALRPAALPSIHGGTGTQPTASAEESGHLTETQVHGSDGVVSTMDVGEYHEQEKQQPDGGAWGPPVRGSGKAPVPMLPVVAVHRAGGAKVSCSSSSSASGDGSQSRLGKLSKVEMMKGCQ